MSLTIANEGKIYTPLVEDEVTIEWARQDTPGKLTFKVVNDGKINFQEGNPVEFKYKNTNLFKGYVFTKKRDKEQIISVTVYDQLRYLKNKDNLRYIDKTATEVIKFIAEKNALKMGEIADTKQIMTRREDNATFFDMIKEALGKTLELTKEMYVLYDDFGKLTLKPSKDMILNYIIDGYSAENFDYESSIDSNTYNTIKLCFENNGNRDYYIEYDSSNLSRWGLLQYFEKINDPKDAIKKAQTLLQLYNTKTRKLSVSGVMGDVRVRGGCFVPVILVLGDVNANTNLLVENVKHKFKNGIHTMDLDLRGGNFV